MSPTLVLACVPDDPLVRQRIGSFIGMDCVPYPDSIEGRCSSCSCKIWIGPRQQAFPNAKPLCLPCAVPEVALGTPMTALSQKHWGEPESSQ